MTPTYRALDFAFRVDAPIPLADVVAESFGALHNSGSDPAREIVIERNVDGSWSLDDDGLALPVSAASRGSALGMVVARLLEHVNQRAAASVEGEVPLHAAAVTSADRRAIALAGRSGSGKSTLGLAAVLAGWGFLAEEVAAVDPATLSVRPYHRPVGLRRGGAAALGLEYPDSPDGRYDVVWPRTVEAERRVTTGRLAAVVLVRRRGGCVSALKPVRPAGALAELAEHCVVTDDRRLVEQFLGLERLVRDVPVLRLDFDTPGEGVALLGEVLGSAGSTPQ